MTARRPLLLALCGVACGCLSCRADSARQGVDLPVQLQNLPPDQIEQRLRALGLQSRRAYRDEPGYPAGALLRLEPPAGSRVPPGSEVTLVMTRPPVPAGAPIIWTTDVGPDAPADVAVKMLDFWRAQGVHITFFVCGAWAYKHPDVLRRMAAEGHHLGNHTYHHYHLQRLSTERIVAELQGTERAVVRLAGPQAMLPKVARPPYGEEDGRVRSAIESAGYRDVLWDIDPIDWDENCTAEQITARILNRAKPGRIILTHVEPRTLQAMPAIFAGLAERRLAPVSLAAAGGSPALPYRLASPTDRTLGDHQHGLRPVAAGFRRVQFGERRY